MKKALLAVRNGFALFLLSLLQLIAWVFTVVTFSLIPLGIGLYLFPEALAQHRAFADLSRRLARDWSGVEIAVPYRPVPRFQRGFFGQIERCRYLLTDPATWRDLLWGISEPVIGGFLAILAAALPVYGLEGVIMPLLEKVYTNYGGSEYYAGIPIGAGWDNSELHAWLCVPVGIAFLGLWIAFSPRLVHTHALWTRTLLGPTQARLAERVQRLTDTRAEAVDASAAELRRIERDLHDGAQARLVAMGMSLGAIEHLLDRDPGKAKLLLAEARQTSARALDDLRDLVRGIHPPVLADRGLADAVRALALDSTLAVEVSGQLPRFQPPVESAAYFAVAEVLTNAAKHSGAGRVWIDMRHEDGLLSVTVTDDGTGGASAEDGTGLRGIERRLAAFDGVLALSSPPGGPTLVTLEIPCAS